MTFSLSVWPRSDNYKNTHHEYLPYAVCREKVAEKIEIPSFECLRKLYSCLRT